MTQVEVENDWAKLEEAVTYFKEQLPDYWFIHSMGCDASPADVEHLTTITELVPKLLDAYGELWEMMEGTIKSLEDQTLPSGLVLPK